MDNEVTDIDEKDIINNSSENLRLLIGAVKEYIYIKKEIISVLIGQSKQAYDEIVSEHKTCTKNIKFSTNLYAIVVFGKNPNEGIISSMNVLPSPVSHLRHNLCSHGMHFDFIIFNKIINLVNNTPVNCICFVGIDVPGIIIWHCPIIDPNKNLSSIQIDTYVLLYKQIGKIYKSNVSIDYKTVSNDQIHKMCNFCSKSPTNPVYCSSCNTIYCSINCQHKHADVHEPFCKNLQKAQSDKKFLNKICGYCKKYNKSARLCNGCQMVRYCNTDCQKSHWKVHQKTCV